MSFNSIVKLIIVAAVVLAIWKYVLPYVTRNQPASSSSERTSPATNCLFEARAANNYWGSNISRFNGTVDRQAWGEFKSHLEDRISRAERKCFCNDDPCMRAKGAMAELRTLASEWDSAAQSGGSAPSDTVQRQESIDNALNAAP
jgi:hypothetical protein